MDLQCVEAETTFNYFDAVRSYIMDFGKPLAFYSDKFGVFKVDKPNALSGTAKRRRSRPCAYAQRAPPHIVEESGALLQQT